MCPGVKECLSQQFFVFFPISSAFHTTEIDHTPAWHADLSFRFTRVTFSTQGWTSAPCHFLRLVGSSIFWPPFQEQGNLLRLWNIWRSCPAPQPLTGLLSLLGVWAQTPEPLHPWSLHSLWFLPAPSFGFSLCLWYLGPFLSFKFS